MPNARVPAAGGAMSAELPTFEEIAALVLRKSAQRLDAMRRTVERDLRRHDRSRAKVEALIETLIAGLDTLDGDGDRECEVDLGGPIDPDCEFDIGDAPHDDERGIYGTDAEPDLGAPEGSIHNQCAWSFGGANDCELDHAEAGIGDVDGFSLVMQEVADEAQLKAHARFDGSGGLLAREQLAAAKIEAEIAPRCVRPAEVRVGTYWVPR